MIHALRRAIRRILEPTPSINVTPLALEPLDVDDVARQLNVAHHAARNGRANLPPATATTFDGPQSQIVQTVEKYVAQNLARVTPAVADLERRVAAALKVEPSSELEAVTVKALLDLDRVVEAWRPRITLARASVDVTAANHERFRAEHGLQRGAHYPSSRILAVGIILTLTVVEAVMNTYFFAIASDQGIVGGLIVSLGCAFVDMFICFTVGRLMTELNHRNPVRRFLGLVPAAAGLVWVPVWALLTGHLREALQARPDDLTSAWQLAGQRLLGSPFSVEQPDTWALIFVGFFLSVGGVMQGWRFDDAYPGYGTVARAYRGSLDAQRGVIDARSRAMSDVVERARRAMDVALATASAAVGALDGNVRTIASVRTTTETFTDQVARSTNALLKLYRDENMRHRGVSAVPAYFDQEYTVELPASFRLPDKPPPHDVELAYRRLSEAKASYPEHVTRLTNRIAELSGD